jgi:hypothetical protein
MMRADMGEQRRLLDEFDLELRVRGLAAPGTIEVCGVFGDLMWRPCRGDLRSLHMDPAFMIISYTRHVAVARVVDEIRFFAARIGMRTSMRRWRTAPSARPRVALQAPRQCSLQVGWQCGDEPAATQGGPVMRGAGAG